jgi:hypothetical protein
MSDAKSDGACGNEMGGATKHSTLKLGYKKASRNLIVLLFQTGFCLTQIFLDEKQCRTVPFTILITSHLHRTAAEEQNISFFSWFGCGRSDILHIFSLRLA